MSRFDHQTFLRSLTGRPGVYQMFDAIGHRVLNLKRIAYGKLELGDLASGKYRLLDDGDLARIFAGSKNTLYKK